MRLSVENCPDELRKPYGPQVGDVFRAKGGRGPTRFWVIVALSASGDTSHVFGFDEDGNICSAQSYRTGYWEERDCIGRAELPDPLPVRWF